MCLQFFTNHGHQQTWSKKGAMGSEHMLLKGADLLLQTLYNSKQSWQRVNSVHYLLFSGDPLHLSFNASTTCSLKNGKGGFCMMLLAVPIVHCART